MQKISIKEFRTLQRKLEKRPAKRSTTVCCDGDLSEEGEQRILAEFLDLLGLRWFHVPNGGQRNRAEGGKLKAQGVKPGVLDNWIVESPPNGPPGSPGTVIELKRRKGGTVSDDQQEWLDFLSKQGWVTAVCHGAEEAINLVLQLGYSSKGRSNDKKRYRANRGDQNQPEQGPGGAGR